MSIDIPKLVTDRLLIQMEPEGNLYNLIVQLCNDWTNFLDVVANQAKPAFDLETAVGDQLDKIGAWVGVPRSGFDDDQYRINIKIQIKIIKSKLARDPDTGQLGNWNGTVNNVLEIVRLFIGPGPGNIVLQNLPPYSFKLTIPAVLTQLEIQTLFQFIRRTIYAAVLGLNIFVLGEDFAWAHAIDIGGGEGEWDPGAVTDEALWAHGEQPIEVISANAAEDSFTDMTAEFKVDDGTSDFEPFIEENAIGAACYWGSKYPFFNLLLFHDGLAVPTLGEGVWEYWNGATWELLPNLNDGTNFFKNSNSAQLVTGWTPADVSWQTTSINGSDDLFFIRARITTIFDSKVDFNQGLIGLPPEGPIGEWIEDAVVGEGIWSGVLSTAGAGIVLSNDNT